ncbi:exo-alpha-sialidase [Actinomadura fibrosa]|uniref:exo-alpha-sialidase n=1 Tax=Actinomadura fibrosa TaxID=111802 RepID=A0ABW2XMZ6_9ACTN|nr:exo-alpha-sialidase [Actinomadura fibrosa]
MSALVLLAAVWVALAMLVPLPRGVGAAVLPGAHQQVFAAGERESGAAEAYACFRAPAVLRARNGDLLAFAEARLGSCADSGRIDIVVKRRGEGATGWGGLRVLARHRLDAAGGPEAFAHNPVPVVDAGSGLVTLLFTENYKRVYALNSEDDGATWKDRREITSDVWKPAWGPLYSGQLGTGPAHGVQLSGGEHPGRLVIGMGYRVAPGRPKVDPKGGAIVHSDDGGRTWRVGASSHGAEPAIGVQELNLFQRGDGAVVAVARNEEGDPSTVDRAAYAVSDDQGDTFDADFRLLPPLDLPDSGVQASVLAMRAKGRDGYDRALLAAPAGPTRADLTIRSSFDGGMTWQSPADGALVRKGYAAYSDMVDLGDGRYGILYEGGDQGQHEFIRFAAFTEADLDMPDDPTSLSASQRSGGLATADPDQVHLFAPTPGGDLGHWFEEADGTVKTGAWGSGIAGEAVSFLSGRQQHVLARGTDGSLQHRFWDAGRGGLVKETWCEPGTVAGAPTGFLASGQQHAFVRTADGRLLHTWWDPGSAAQRTQTWAAAGTVAGDPVSVPFGDQQHVWAAGTDGQLHHWWWTKGPGVRHETWGGSVRGTPTALVYRGELHVFAADSGGRLAHWWWSPDTQVVEQQAWATPVPLAGRPASFVHGAQQHVFARTTDGTLAHWWWDPAYTAPRYAVWAGALRSDPVTLLAGDVQHVFGAGADGSVTHWWWDRAGGIQHEGWGGRMKPAEP